MRHDQAPGGAARQLIAAVVRRRRAQHAAWSVLAAVAVASAVLALSSGLKPDWPATVPLAAVAGALAGAFVMWRTAGRRSRRAAAKAIEQADPLCRNVVITAEELDHHPGRASSWMASRVFTEADRRTDRISRLPGSQEDVGLGTPAVLRGGRPLGATRGAAGGRPVVCAVQPRP